jgi:hypothetical protein
MAMNSDLRFVLVAFSVGALIGIPLALFVVRFRPNWCIASTRYLFDRKWWLFLVSFLMLTAYGIYLLQQAKPYSASFFFFLGCLNLFSFVTVGFRTFTEASNFTHSNGSIDMASSLKPQQCENDGTGQPATQSRQPKE